MACLSLKALPKWSTVSFVSIESPRLVVKISTANLLIVYHTILILESFNLFIISVNYGYKN
ncbi:hypothetical protein GCM10028778_24100 [Barrientosiimonas marina]